jgi:aminoglycoside phosphotransferase (APT) family kinase protein
MLIDAAGRLRIIDTERIAIGPAGFDLGWTWHRWNMPPRAWERFLAGYRAGGGVEPEAARYWRIVTGLTLARVFWQHIPSRLEAQIVKLQSAGLSGGAEEIP